MKKVLKIVLISLLAIITAISMVACSNNGGNTNSKEGITGSVVSGNIYEVRHYYAKENESEIVISKEALSLPENVTSIRIKSNAFANNSTLTKITVTSDVSEIGAGAFAKMTALTTLELPFVGRYFKSDAFVTGEKVPEKAVDSERTIAHLFGTEEYDKGSQVSVKYGADSKVVYMPETLKTVVINNTTAEGYNIPMFAFNGVTALSKIELKGNIVGIGEYAFNLVAGIDTLELPASVKTIYKGAFNGARIKNILLSENVSDIEIRAEAFANMPLLNYFGKKVTEIPAYTIDFSGVMLTKEVEGEQVSALGANAFNFSATKVYQVIEGYTLETPTYNYLVKNFDATQFEKVFNIELGA